MRTPLHLKADDRSEAADLAHIKLHGFMANLTGGRGFRTPGKNSKKTRVERLGEANFA